MKMFDMAKYVNMEALYKDKGSYWEAMFDTLLEMSSEEVIGRKLVTNKERTHCIDVIEAVMEDKIHGK